MGNKALLQNTSIWKCAKQLTSPGKRNVVGGGSCHAVMNDGTVHSL